MAQESREPDVVVLARVCEKIINFAEKIGVTPQEMISFLDSGATARDLLDYLASRGNARTA